jgi:hypothetical protein
VIREAHDGSIVSLHFFANEPILMSSAADNSIKVSACFSFHFSVAVVVENCMHCVLTQLHQLSNHLEVAKLCTLYLHNDSGHYASH